MNEWVELMAAEAARELVRVNAHRTNPGKSKGALVRVAVVDSGCDIAHPCLAGSIADSKSYQKREGVLNERRSHGTQSCGLVAGAPGGDGAFPGGMAHGHAALYAVRYDSDVDPAKDVTMYNEVFESGARIISNSFGFPRLEVAEAEQLRDEALSPIEEQGGVLVFSAGNEGQVLDLTRLPMTPNTILVGATGMPDRSHYMNEVKLASSNYGRGLTVCALAGGAEGGKAVSTSNRGKGDNRIHSSRDFDYHTDTSGACALVAGVIALMLRANPKLTPKQVKTVLCATADKVDPNQRGQWIRVSELPDEMLRDLDISLMKRYYSPRYGFGRVNAEDAVREAFRLADVEV